MSSTSSSRMSSNKVKRILKRIGIGLAIFVVVLVVAVELLLQTGALTGLAVHYAEPYVDGKLSVGRVTGSIITHFPRVYVELEDAQITYPHGRFSYARDITPDPAYASEGCGPQEDTLLTVKTLGVCYGWLGLFSNTIDVHDLLLEDPRFFYHDFGELTTLAVFGVGVDDGQEPEPEEEPLEEGEGSFLQQEAQDDSWRLRLKNITLKGRPHIVYTAAADDIYAVLDESELILEPELDSELLTLQLRTLARARAMGYCVENARLELSAMSRPLIDFGADDLPDVWAHLRIPEGTVDHEGMPRPGRVQLGATARTLPTLDIDVDTLYMRADGLRAELAAGAEDLMGDDPLLRLRGFLAARVDSLLFAVPEDMEVLGHGGLDLDIDAAAHVSALDALHYPEAQLTADLATDDLWLLDRTDSVEVSVPQGHIHLASMENRFDDSIPLGSQVLGVRADFDSLYFRYCETMTVRGKDLMLAAQNSALQYGDDNAPMGAFTPFMVFFKAGRLGYRDASEPQLMLGLIDTKNSLRVASDSLDRQIPRIDVRSTSGGIFMRQDVSRYGLRNAHFEASAKLNAFDRVRRRKALLDSLQRRYPGVPRDSLFARSRAERRASMKENIEWLTSEELKQGDISVELDEDILAYFRDWDLDGTARIGSGRMMSPYFPLRTSIDTLSADFTMDQVVLNDFSVRAGESHLAARGSLKGIRRAIQGRGPYMLKMSLDSESLNADELMSAAAVGEEADVASLRDSVEFVAADDEQYAALFEQDSLTHEIPRLNFFVVPANLVADVDMVAQNVRYGDLDVSWLTCDMKMRERILQLTNTVARSNMGDVYLDCFYATQSVEDIGAGLNVSFIGIDAGQVAGLYPEMFDDVPYVNDVSGNVECQFAALTRFDTEMDPVLSSLNGVMRVTGGKDNASPDARETLRLKNDAELRKMLRWLLFRNRRQTVIKELDASFLINDGQLEILPFILGVDRYRIALAGIQQVDPDQAFQYSISIIKSPLLIPFGINFYGPDFDNWDFKLTRAKYRNKRSLPQLETDRSVSESQARVSDAIAYVFETGVAGAMDAARPVSVLERMKAEADYRFEMPTDTLSVEETQMLRSMQDGAEEDLTAEEYVIRELLKLRVREMGLPLKTKEEMKDDE